MTDIVFFRQSCISTFYKSLTNNIMTSDPSWTLIGSNLKLEEPVTKDPVLSYCLQLEQYILSSILLYIDKPGKFFGPMQKKLSQSLSYIILFILLSLLLASFPFLPRGIIDFQPP